MTKIIFTNQKGGVGKTTLTRELGIALTRRKLRVLLIDCDPQGNLTKSLVSEEAETKKTRAGVYEAMEGEPVRPYEVAESLSLLGGDERLAALEKRYIGEVDAYERLSAALTEKLLKRYDVVLLDSPPSLSVMTINALAAATHFIIPLRPALYSLHGTNDLLGSVAKVKKSLNPELELLGVIINEYTPGPIISRQIRQEIEEGFGNKVFQTSVSRTVKVEEAIAARRGVVDEPEGTKIRQEIQAIALELCERLGL
jgi:chromosome partitioning protein